MRPSPIGLSLMASQMIMLSLLLLALAMVCRAHGLLPTLLLDKASPLSDISAEKILQEVNKGTTISKQLCKEAGFLCGTSGSSSSGEYDNIFVYAKGESPSTAKADDLHLVHKLSELEGASPTHGHENEDKAGVLFFRMATASKGHNVVLPPLGDSSGTLQASKFLHPRLEKVFGDMSVPRLLTTMGIPTRSGLAHKTIEKERLCTAEEPLSGEVKKCVASAHAMLEFAASVLKASQHELKYMVNTRTQAVPEVFEVVDNTMVDQNFVPCHTMLFPYALYMCHNIPKTVVLKVTLRDSKGDKVTVPAICHMDTSHFEPSHIGFQVLHTRPGVGEMCHWMPNSTIIWYTETAA